jgi:hypothetical protein
MQPINIMSVCMSRFLNFGPLYVVLALLPARPATWLTLLLEPYGFTCTQGEFS